MIETADHPTLAATILHRVVGDIDLQQAEQGAAAALAFLLDRAATHGTVRLVLDLRGAQLAGPQAHRVWSQGFARNPALQQHVRAAAVVGDDTPSLRVEQEALATDRLRFFVEPTAAEEWLAQQ